MSIRPECNKCLQELEEPGAIILSPPDGALVQKFHLCATCYGKLVEWLEERGTALTADERDPIAVEPGDWEGSWSLMGD
jgi:hypothetical protein